MPDWNNLAYSFPQLNPESNHTTRALRLAKTIDHIHKASRTDSLKRLYNTIDIKSLTTAVVPTSCPLNIGDGEPLPKDGRHLVA